MDRLRRWLPGAGVALGYRRAWLRGDVVAGCVLVAILVPAGIGYARVSGLPPETGLYATVVPILAYALVGPSRILVLGPDSSLAPIVAAAVLPLAAGSPQRAAALAGLLAVLVGALLAVGAAVRAGAITALLSKPIRVGYLNGIAVVVVTGQLPALLGLDGARVTLGGPLRITPADGWTWQSAALGITCLAALVAARRTGRTPVALVVVMVGAGVLVAAAGLTDRVATVGALPGGLPAPAFAVLTWTDVGALAGPAAGIALIAFADAAVLSRSFASRHGERVDGDVEMRAVGAANLATGLLGGFPVSASATRTPVAEAAGARTQLATVVGAVLVASLVLLAPGATAYLPTAAIAAVVVVAAWSLVDVRGVGRLLRADRVEGLLAVAAFTGVVLLGVLEGIVVAVGLSLAAFVHQAWRPYRAELGRAPGLRGYHDLSRHPEAARVPGCVIVRFDAPLFFANGALLDDWVRTTVAQVDGVRLVVLAAEPITDLDSTAVDHLVALDDYLASRAVRLVLAEMKGPVKDRLRRYDELSGAPRRFGPDRFAPTVGAAVDAFTGELRGDL
jgi:high affinity sulfate transporter 1